ncbi:DnaD domain-containing protein [Alteribacter natronophilus]|uniref:DnaD domain-containing protein n=1 Tax=Alteribacter natronophilus TaxID=2583810 RepID=UPI00110D4688|nr:DnaD domain-containing protein [Alteribacter natronophilus]TMW73558.1 DnaD domain-containing protein [Alteribacter natronophilus]
MNSKWMLDLMSRNPVTVPALLMEHYAGIGITEEEMMLMLHIRKYAQEGEPFPTPDALSSKMTTDMSRTAGILRDLVKKGFLMIGENQDQHGRISEFYSLEPLYSKLADHLEAEQHEKREHSAREEEGRIFKRFEEEFSRPLSPMEIEMISMWIDEDYHDPVLIEAALRESVVSGKLNFRYIDRILFEWKKNNIRTVAEAREYGERIRGQRTRTKVPERTETASVKRSHPSFNWLETD